MKVLYFAVALAIIASTVRAGGHHGAMPIYRASLAQLGNSGVTGEVTVFTENGKTLFGAGMASGLEANINDNANCTATNGCGVHVHSGTGCENSTVQGGHYYKGATDPWASVRYKTTSAAGKASFEFIVNDAGTDIEGKVFIIHNNAGGRVACGALVKQSPGQYANTQGIGANNVASKVTIFTTSDTIYGAGTATGLEANLNDATNCTAANGCGVHVHSGTGCADSTAQGGHYYTVASDPWVSVRYKTTTADGNASFVFGVKTGATETAGKPFIVHANDGSRVSCGIIESSAIASTTTSAPSAATTNAPSAATTTASGKVDTTTGTDVSGGTRNFVLVTTALTSLAYTLLLTV